MLRLGLTGGIGAGKSTVARRLVGLGAYLIDADVIAREVVAPGSPGLAGVAAEFGAEVLDPDGALDRPALAAVVFTDEDARARLNAIVHPLVRHRTEEMLAAAPADGIVLQDIPLLVEGGMAAAFHLVLVVDAAVDERVRRLVGRGMTAEDARARIAAQADEAARRAVADVWLDNSAEPSVMHAELDKLWRDRLVPFESNLRTDRRSAFGPPRLAEPNPEWPSEYARLAARVRFACGDAVRTLDHIGSTSVPGLPAKDVLDIQLGVDSLERSDELVGALRGAGFVRWPSITRDTPKASQPDPEAWRKRLYINADPGRPANLHVRVVDSPGWRYALMFRDWLCANASARDEYLAAKRALAAAHATDQDTSAYAQAKEPWFDRTEPLAEAWARSTGWRPRLDGPHSE